MSRIKRRGRLLRRVAVGFAAGASVTLMQGPGPVLATHPRYTGTIKYTIFEQFGVTATETFFSFAYGDNGTSIDSPTTGSGGCYESGFAGGWDIRECTYYVFNNLPQSAQRDIVGDFDHWTGPSYTQFSYYRAVPGGANWQCELTRGSLPPGWDPECSPSRNPK